MEDGGEPASNGGPASSNHQVEQMPPATPTTGVEPVAAPETSNEAYPVENGEEIINESSQLRVGTIASARFNILSTMVGGGCLSLPLAFQQSGNALVGPLLLILTGFVTDFCFRLLVACSVHLSPPHRTTPGSESFESITSAAFGPRAYVMSMGLVTLMCLFGAVGYCVLLRDMMEPINDWIRHNSIHIANRWLQKNFTMFAVVLVVTPACTLQTFTALKNCGAASMTSILILGSCIVVRSVQCNVNAPEPWYTYLKLWPESPRELLDALPLYISCFVCHYNIFPVHNELKDPSPSRVSWWLRSTTWFAVGLYLIMGFAGSSYGHCTPTGKVQGNVLLDFDENDPLLLVGRMCLALTITLAFPLLVIPARDILLRSVVLPRLALSDTAPPLASSSTALEGAGEDLIDSQEQLQEPLLTDEERQSSEHSREGHEETISASFRIRLATAIGIFWTASLAASCVESIDIVWDLLGSSLSILLSYLIPCASYLVIKRNETGQFWSKALCWLLLSVFVPLMFVSTGNAIVNTFVPKTNR